MATEQLAARLVQALVEAGQTVATAESLTGGLIGAAITAVPGASEVYLGGVITYATALKATLGDVPSQVLSEFGPVSGQTAAAMAAGAKARTGADWAISATGVAGPDGQDGHLPGEVWLGLADPSGATITQRIQASGTRAEVRAASVDAALSLVLARLDTSSS